MTVAAAAVTTFAPFRGRVASHTLNPERLSKNAEIVQMKCDFRRISLVAGVAHDASHEYLQHPGSLPAQESDVEGETFSAVRMEVAKDIG
jgi:hypothetical protein